MIKHKKLFITLTAVFGFLALAITVIVLVSIYGGKDDVVITMPAGTYYLDGDDEGAYIDIIDMKTMRFSSFNATEIADIIYEATDNEPIGIESYLVNSLYYYQRVDGNRIVIDVDLSDYSIGLQLTFDPDNKTIKFNDGLYYWGA